MEVILGFLALAIMLAVMVIITTRGTNYVHDRDHRDHERWAVIDIVDKGRYWGVYYEVTCLECEFTKEVACAHIKREHGDCGRFNIGITLSEIYEEAKKFNGHHNINRSPNKESSRGV